MVNVAISLVNHAESDAGLADLSSCIEILREDDLQFDHVRFALSLARSDAPLGVEIECVIFDDGSRVTIS